MVCLMFRDIGQLLEVGEPPGWFHLGSRGELSLFRTGRRLPNADMPNGELSGVSHMTHFPPFPNNNNNIKPFIA